MSHLRMFEMTMRNFEVFAKKSHNSSDDYKFAVTATETEKTRLFLSS